MRAEYTRMKESFRYLEESFEILPLSNDVIIKYCEIYKIPLKQRGIVLPEADLLVVSSCNAT